MEVRREPRFEIYAPARLTLLDSPERELDCLLLDVSGTGLKFVVSEDLHTDEVVALDVENHLVLADVRYSQPRGEKFAIGAERIHGVDKSALPQDKSRAEQIRFVVEDYRSRIRMAIAGEPAHVKNQDLPIPHRDQLAEAAVQSLMEQWSQEPEGSATEGTLRAAIVEPAADHATGCTPVPPLAVAQPQQPERSSWRLPFITAGAIAMITFTGSLFWSYQHSVAATPSGTAAIATARVAAKPAPAIPVGVARTLRAEIRATEPVWIYAISDGKALFQKLLAKNETRQFEFADNARLRVGNAGGVEIRVDGQSTRAPQGVRTGSGTAGF